MSYNNINVVIYFYRYDNKAIHHVKAVVHQLFIVYKLSLIR